jgi:polysaccharide export outer membrane protein
MRERTPILWAGLALLSFVWGCASTPEEPLVAQDISLSDWVVNDELLTIETPPSVIPEEDADLDRYRYELGPGDVVQVRVWGDQSISGTYRIGPDGDITLPLFGSVAIADQTRDEAATMLEELLQEHYIDPRVTVIVDEFNNNNVFLLGAFNWPGEYKLESQATLLQALSLAKGFTPDADRSGLTITRGASTVIRINLDELLRGGNMSLNVRLRPGDVLFLPENTMRVVHVLGEVNAPGMVPVGRGIDLLRALAGAGSMTENAVVSEVRILRRVEDKVRIFTVDVEQIYEDGALMANIPLQAEDIVFVPQRGLSKLNYVLRQLSPSFSTIFALDQIRDFTNGD